MTSKPITKNTLFEYYAHPGFISVSNLIIIPGGIST